MGRTISEHVERRLIAESMGRCMNPDCKTDLLRDQGDIMERAHIRPFCDTADNSYDNLIVLCPNCHTNFDKISAFSPADVKMWKVIRRKELDEFFRKTYLSFDDLSREVVPLLQENRAIYTNYYLGDNRALWDKFEWKVLINNMMLKKILSNNLHLFQQNTDENYSNVEIVKLFLLHIDEFEATRGDINRCREVLFPPRICSIFGVFPVNEPLFPSVESLEALIQGLNDEGKIVKVSLDNDDPFIQFVVKGKPEQVFLNDVPRLRQYYSMKKSFRKTKVKLDSLLYILKFIKSRGIGYCFIRSGNLREIEINETIVIFTYEYCLTKVGLLQLSPIPGSIVVNLHNWNGGLCISQEAYVCAEEIDVTLFNIDAFRGYINDLSRKRRHFGNF